MAGMSKIFSVGRYLLLVAVAISPLPIILLIFGDRFANWPI
jgi:hypothetical protein